MTPSAPTLLPSQDNVPESAGLAYLHGRYRQGIRPRLVVLGTTMDDAVSAAGGRICDLAMAGWEVTVLAGTLDDPLPAHILGASALELDAAFARRRRRRPPRAVAISAELLATEDRLRRRLQEYPDSATIEISIWGPQYAAETADRTEITTHRLSHAARAFKKQALRAVRGGADTVAPTENFGTALASRWALPACDPAAFGGSVR
ncbi:hypothetical protein [Nocardia carnea]|uniref:hypothetical protein n=1 Tax=Nocardia carnea TaxID=37328 RepID=UPI00245804FB|nr:hypothetical protein [Nocardia carnea]